MRRLSSIAALIGLAACATYSPKPLDNDASLLSAPVIAVLARDAAAIDRPYLKPAAIDLSAPLDTNAIATLAVLGNPDLKAQRLRAGVADAQLFSAKLLPDPTISIGASKVLAGPDTMLDLANSLSLDINMLRTRGVRIAQARAQARQVRLDLVWAEWQTAGQARIQAVRIQYLERSLVLATATRDAAHSLLARTMRAAGRGDVAGDQVQAARTAAFDADDKLRTTEKDLTTARFELAKLLGLPPSYPLTLAPIPLAPAPPDTARLFEVARAQRADLQALQAGYDAQEASVHKAVLDQFPTLGLVVNGNRDSAGNTLVGPAIDFTLPLWNRNRGGIAVEQATRDALKAENEGRLFQTRADIAAAIGGIAVARRQRDGLLRDLPAAEAFAAASRRAANRGDLSPATGETAEQAARDKHMLIAQAEQDLSEQTIALELLTGIPMEDWPR